MELVYSGNLFIPSDVVASINGGCDVTGNVTVAGVLTHGATDDPAEALHLNVGGGLWVTGSGKIDVTSKSLAGAVVNHYCQRPVFGCAFGCRW